MTRVREWLASCVRVATENGVPEEADLEAAALAFIDGEPARMAAAREEQREADARFCPNCLGVGFVERPVPCPYCDDSTHDHYCPTGTQRQQCGCGAERIRNTPLTATPLADEIAALRALVAELEASTFGPTWRFRAEKAEAECDKLAESLRLANENVVKMAQAHTETVASRDALRAQVKAVEVECERQRLSADATFRSRRAALAIRRAMDEAKP